MDVARPPTSLSSDGVRLRTGMAFSFIAESCSAWPESQIAKQESIRVSERVQAGLIRARAPGKTVGSCQSRSELAECLVRKAGGLRGEVLTNHGGALLVPAVTVREGRETTSFIRHPATPPCYGSIGHRIVPNPKNSRISGVVVD